MLGSTVHWRILQDHWLKFEMILANIHIQSHSVDFLVWKIVVTIPKYWVH